MVAAKRKSKKLEHDELFTLVAGVVGEWDPYALLASGAPRDEFDSEVSSVVAQVSRIKSEIDAAHTISRVFSSSFEPGLFTPEACAEVGQRLFAQLQEHGHIS